MNRVTVITGHMYSSVSLIICGQFLKFYGVCFIESRIVQVEPRYMCTITVGRSSSVEGLYLIIAWSSWSWEKARRLLCNLQAERDLRINFTYLN